MRHTEFQHKSRRHLGANASIISFIKEADRHQCRLVVSGSEISGLVTLSDIQKLPVRAALFAVITQLEMIMAAAIRRAIPETSDWLRYLNDNRKEKLQESIAESRQEDIFVDDLLFTQFADKVTILRTAPNLIDQKKVFKRDMKDAEDLRNHLAHANDFAPTRARAEKTCATVRSIETWIDRLSNLPPLP